MPQVSKSEDDQEGYSQPISAMEWIVSALGAILVCVMIGSTLYQGVRSTSPYPEVSVEVEHVENLAAGYHVVFNAQNTGDATAAQVTIQGQLIRDGLSIETVSVTLDFVPAQSEARGGMLFENNAGELELKIRAVSYTDP